MIIFLSVIVFIFLLMMINISVFIKYDRKRGEIISFIKIGFYKYCLYPQKKKRKLLKFLKERKRKRIKQVKQFVAKKEHRESFLEQYTVKDLIAGAVDIIKGLSIKFRKYLKFRSGVIDITVGTDEAFKTAMIYSGIAQAITYFHCFMTETFNAKFKKINIVADFGNNYIDIKFDMKFTFKVYQLLNIGMFSVIHFLKIKKRVGGIRSPEGS